MDALSTTICVTMCLQAYTAVCQKISMIKIRIYSCHSLCKFATKENSQVGLIEKELMHKWIFQLIPQEFYNI